MREILFRGKDAYTGKWVYGWVFGEEAKSIIELDTQYVSEEGVEAYYTSVVIPETVGQYTGLQDVYGGLIFEGDILECEFSTERFVVEFDTKTAQFTTKSNWLWSILDRCEVIGNIHDNPEPLK